MYQVGKRERFDHSAELGIVLLHGDDLFDVLDILGEARHFPEHFLLLGGHVVGQRLQVGGEHSSFGILSQKSRQVRGMFPEQGQRFAEVGHPRLAQAGVQQGDRDIHAR